MSHWITLFFTFLPVLDLINGRLTEVSTERLPILAHKLHTANIDLKVLSRRALLGPRSGFRFKNGEFHQTAKGSQRVRLVQTYAGYEVYGPTAVAELDMRGYFTGHLYGDVARNLHKDIPNPESCVRNVKALLNIAIRLEKLNPDNPKIDKRDGRRVIYADQSKRKARIVYVVEFFYIGDKFVSSPVYYFDACSNSMMFSYENVRNMSVPYLHTGLKRSGMQTYFNNGSNNNISLTFNPELQRSRDDVGCEPLAEGKGGNKNTDRIYYNSPPLCLPVKRAGGTCRMEGGYVRVIDNKNSRSMNKNTVVSFKCSQGYSDSVNGAYGVANDALFFGEMASNFFHTFFGQRALPYKPRIVVHYGKDYENAFWTGKDMFFGDGKDYFYPLVSLDILAHELAHGFTRRHSDLMYRAQPGGINEAYSDISGVTTWHYVYGKANWEIGGTLLKSGSGALRYINNPPKDGRSIKNIWLYNPLMDVHHSSGVFNYAFYRMARSWRGTLYEAFANFFIANKLLWGRYTRFRKGACNVVQASYDSGTSFRVVKRGFRTAGFPLIFCRHRALKTTLFPGETRHGILVSNNRSPILEVDMSHWPGFGVEARTDTTTGAVLIVLTTDGDADNVVAKGNNYVKFPANHTTVYVKLMCDQKEDIKVTLKVLN